MRLGAIILEKKSDLFLLIIKIKYNNWMEINDLKMVTHENKVL